MPRPKACDGMPRVAGESLPAGRQASARTKHCLPPRSRGTVPHSYMANVVMTSPVDMGARKSLDIRPGDTVRVWQKIEEKGKVRLQAFEGLVIARKHGREAGGTFTVRRIASGVGVEKIYPLYAPMIDRVEIVKHSRVRRAKLYFIRDKAARESRRQLRRSKMMDTRVTSDTINKEKAAALEKAAKEADKTVEA